MLLAEQNPSLNCVVLKYLVRIYSPKVRSVFTVDARSYFILKGITGKGVRS